MIWQGIGEKVQAFIFNFVMIVAGFTIGFSQGWELSLVMLLYFPLTIIGGATYIWTFQNELKRILKLTKRQEVSQSKRLYRLRQSFFLA